MKRALIVILSLAVSLGASDALAQSEFCFALTDAFGSNDDVLTRIDPGDSDPGSNEETLGGTGTEGIIGLAMRPGTGEIFGVNGRRLGVLNPTTGRFSPRGADIGQGQGDFGQLTMNLVSGLAFEPGSGVLYGTTKLNNGFGVLYKIDANTGRLVQGAFGGDDYATLPQVSNGNFEDLSFEPSTGTLYGILNSSGGPALIRLNKDTGQHQAIINFPLDAHIEGMDFDEAGALWIVGRIGDTGEYLWSFDEARAEVTSQIQIDNGRDYEGLICVVPAASDAAVALSTDNLDLDSNGEATFEVRLSNPGESELGRVDVSVVLPQGLAFVEADAEAGSFNAGSGVWTHEGLAPGAEVSLSVVARVEIDSGTLTVSAEAQVQGATDVDPENNRDSLSFQVDLAPNGDPDGDGLSNAFELEQGTDPLDADTDDDNLSDSEELQAGTDPRDADSDNDGLDDGVEVGPDPRNPLDNDQDGLIDARDPNNDDGPAGDLDGDGVRNDTDNCQLTGNPDQADTDGDGDGDACDNDRDTDGDGIADEDDNCQLVPNTDQADTDGDGKGDACDRDELDTDEDGLTDVLEESFGLNPDDADSDDDGVLDAAEPRLSEDTDGDGLINALDPDSDNDGLADGTEMGIGLDRVHIDTQVDRGTFVADEDPSRTTDPLVADTDGGGVPDGAEDLNRNGRLDVGETDPLNPSDDEGELLDPDPTPNPEPEVEPEVEPEGFVAGGGGGGESQALCGVSKGHRGEAPLGWLCLLLVWVVWRRR